MDELMETIAMDMGYKPDKYYTAKEKMFKLEGDPCRQQTCLRL